MTKLPLRDELAGVEPYGAPQRGDLIQLNVNENPFPPPPEVVEEITEAVAEVAPKLNRYPDREFTALREALAGYLAAESGADFLTAEHIWAANGSNEAMLHLFQAYGGPDRWAMWTDPTYSMYPEYARDTNTRPYAFGRRGADFSLELPTLFDELRGGFVSLVIVASPNNPTGTLVPLAEIEELCRRTIGPDGASAVVIVDEAYAEFRAPGTPSALTLLPRYPNLVVSRTMSKAFALAGARVGYLAANPPLLRDLRRVRLPYHLSAVTQAVACAALKHAPALQQQVALLRSERDLLIEYLRSLRVAGRPLDVPDSHANFALFGAFDDRHAIWRGLVDRGVLIREVGPPGYLRVSVGTPDDNAAFRGALDAVLDARATSVGPPKTGER